jgi:hypothetical protein
MALTERIQREDVGAKPAAAATDLPRAMRGATDNSTTAETSSTAPVSSAGVGEGWAKNRLRT